MALTSSPLHVWLLSDGSPGHLSQSRGVAESIGRFAPVEINEIDLKVRRRLVKSFLRYLLPVSEGLSKRLLRLVYLVDLPKRRPGLIVSSGGNTLLASALLRQIYNVPNLYSGTLKKYPASCYSQIYTVTPQGCENNCILPLPPVPLAMTETYPQNDSDAPWLALVGGDGAGYLYSEKDWSAFAKGLNALAQEFGIRWLLTTSRRTGKDAEKILQNTIKPDFVVEAVYYDQKPRQVVRDFLKRCQRVLVTEDSLTMVAESIYSGRPVMTLRPQHAEPESNDATALNSYERNGLITRSSFEELNMQDNLPVTPAADVPDVPKMIWESVRDLLIAKGGTTHV